jgi:hypothetical protein
VPAMRSTGPMKDDYVSGLEKRVAAKSMIDKPPRLDEFRMPGRKRKSRRRGSDGPMTVGDVGAAGRKAGMEALKAGMSVGRAVNPANVGKKIRRMF